MFEFLLDQRRFIFVIASLVLFLFYLVGLAVYRLYLCPIAKFPGPRLAALTYLYEGYFDVVKRGKYTFKIRDLHAKYGELFFHYYVI